jgi:hypothetical protein
MGTELKPILGTRTRMSCVPFLLFLLFPFLLFLLSVGP